MKFIEKPYLPNNSVVNLIVGKGALRFADALSSYGVSFMMCESNGLNGSLIDSHADVSVLYFGNGNFFLANEQKSLSEKLSDIGAKCSFISEKSGCKYPHDCLLNCLITDSFLICNEKAVSADIVDFSAKNHLEIINVRQGYVKCSVCPVSENAFITDDETIFNALKNLGCDMLYVKKGSVALRGADYGFIGGCCGKIANDIIAFCGDVKTHSDYDKIKSFALNYSVSLLSLGNDRLEDVGSLIPITEKEE